MDIDKKFKHRVNEETLIYQGIQSNYWENVLKNFITNHYNETGSLHAKKIIYNWESE